MHTLKQYLPNFVFLFLAFGLSLVTLHYPPLTSIFHTDIAGVYPSLALLFVVGLGVHHYSPNTPIPLFVWAILFGMALQLPLLSLVADRGALVIIIELFAAFILFTGGINVPVKNFKRYFAPIATLSILGTVLSILLFALSLSWLTHLYGFEVSALALLILAAILSSIDPTTVIPTLNHLHFRRPFIRDIAVSESAVNDVVGVIITRFFLVAALGITGTTALTVSEGFAPILSRSAFDMFAAEVVWGILVGLLGAWILKTWGASIGEKHWSDPALFFSIPIFCFALGSIVGGSGFLAAFVAGLLFETHQHTREVHEFFDGLVDRFMKPMVFVLLGAFAPLYALLDYVTLGTLVTIMLIFFIRPLVVFISLIPWMVTKRALLDWREVLFLSFIRDTGAIPAILVLYAVAVGVMGAQFIFSIALWVIIITLIVEPPLTKILAKRLEVAR